MPVARYFLFVGGVLLALLFVVSALVPQDTVVAGSGISSPDFDKTMVRIKSTQKLPERVVYDTSRPTLVPSQVNAVAAAAPVVTPEMSARMRVRDTFAQFVPAEARNDAQADAKGGPEAKPLAQQAQAQPVQKKRRVARVHPPRQMQPMRLAQPSMFQPFRVAQQQQRFGLFSGFGTW